MLDFQQPYNQFSEHDEKKLRELVNMAVRGPMCEVGCWTGHSTSIIARKAHDFNRIIYVVDNFKGNEGTPLAEYAKINNVKEMFIDNMKSLNILSNLILLDMDSSEAYGKVPNDLTFIFIDAGHTYEDVKKDLINYRPKLRIGGIICGHDYESETYDERYINEDYVDGKHHGVIKAVNEVLGKVEHEGRMWWLKLNNS